MKLYNFYGVRFFKKIQDPKEFESGFCVSLLNRSIQDYSDHGASRESSVDSSVSLKHHDPRDLGLIHPRRPRGSATSRDDAIFSGESLLQELKSLWELILTEPVLEEVEFRPADWAEKSCLVDV